jgi:hypothetical protein
MAKSKGSSEYEQAGYVGQPEPDHTDMGASKINYGEQRFGMGVLGEEPREYAEPGSEGAIAVDLMRERGGISSHQKFDSPMSGTPTGE